jgi:hypothetical protein
MARSERAMWRHPWICLLAALVAVGGCADLEKSQSRLEQERAFANICAFAARGTSDEHLTCSDVAQVVYDHAPKTCPNSGTQTTVLVTKPLLLKQCEQMLGPAYSKHFCADFADQQYREFIRASPPSCGPTEKVAGFLGLWELGRACVLLADRVPGGAPKIGICIYGMNQDLFPAFQTDRSNLDDDRAASQIEQRFPAGTPIDSMRNILESSGFTCSPVAANGDCTATRYLIGIARRQLAGVGVMTWKVHWRANQMGQLDKLDVEANGVSM